MHVDAESGCNEATKDQQGKDTIWDEKVIKTYDTQRFSKLNGIQVGLTYMCLKVITPRAMLPLDTYGILPTGHSLNWWLPEIHWFAVGLNAAGRTGAGGITLVSSGRRKS